MGWTELGPAPWDGQVVQHFGFWSGREVVVAGGFDMNEAETEVRFAHETYAFSPDALRWRQLAPLPLDGFDGVVGLTGALTPTGWVGLGYPCTSGEITVEGSASERCAAVPLLFGYSDVDGWTVRDLPAAAAGLFAEQLGPVVIDVLGVDATGQVLVANPAGLSAIGIVSAVLSAAPLARWADLGVGFLLGACRIGDALVALTAPQRLGASESNGQIVPTPIRLVTASLTAGLAIPTGSTALGETTYSLDQQCLPELGLLFAPNPPVLGGHPQLITPTGTVNWGAPFAQGQAVLAPLPGELADVQSELLQFTPTGGRVLDSTSGQEIATLAPTPTFELTVWTGAFLLVITNTTNTSAALTPDTGWARAGGSTFPETFEPGD